jgi:serine acetyltransferase
MSVVLKDVPSGAVAVGVPASCVVKVLFDTGPMVKAANQ